MLNRKLGRLPAKFDSRTLKFERYVTTALPTPPAHLNWTSPKGNKMSWPMMVNNAIGDCTIAAAGHMVELWTRDETGVATIIPDAQIVSAYSAISGYDPVTGANDDGCALLDVMNYWQSTGIGGHKITGYMSVTPTNQIAIEQAMWLFGAVDLGINLPITAQNQTGAGLKWAVPPGGAVGDGAPGSWGGHSIPIVSYDQTGLLVVTWGALQFVTWPFLFTYCDEAYACLSQQDWLARGGNAPNGFNLAQLQADLAAL
jgi:hypothetical protein